MDRSKSHNDGSKEQLPKDCFHRKVLVASHEQLRTSTEQMSSGGGKYALPVSAGPTKPSPVSSPWALSALTEIYLPQLEVGKRHCGRALFGTLCVQAFAFKISFVSTVLADESGKAVRVRIHNVASLLSSKNVEARFPTGLKVAIKEPYFKLFADGTVGLSVENPEEFVTVDDSRQEVIVEDLKALSRASNVIELGDPEQELENIRLEGNRLFSEKDWSQAIEKYTKCIARSSVAVGGDGRKMKESLLLAYSNRAESWLQLHNYRDALDDANKALEFDPDHLKSISRRSRAWQGFGRLQAAPLTEKLEVVTKEPPLSEPSVQEEKSSKVKSKKPKRMQVAVKLLSGKQSLNSNGDSGSQLKCTDGEDNGAKLTNLGVENATISNDEYSTAGAKAIDTTISSLSADSDLQITPHAPSRKEWPAIDREGPHFASWLDSVRSAGDAFIAEKKWELAIRMYDRVTEFSLPKKNKLKVMQTMLLACSNKAEACIWLGDFETALRNAEHALTFDTGKHQHTGIGFDARLLLNELRRGRALHGLGQYEQACAVFSAARAKSPNDKIINDLLETSMVSCSQSREGMYDLNDYFLNGCKGPPPPCSDFVGPVEIRRVFGKGRGLFLTRDVEPGELLLVSNPLAVVRRRYQGQSVGKEDYRQLASNWRTNDTKEMLEDFVGRLALLQSKRSMYQLHLLAIVDTAETEIPDVNVFVPGSELVLPESWQDLPTDLERIRGIVLKNAIDGGLNPLDAAHDQKIGCVGLWALPSFMNHSCVPNCHMMDLGNAMFVRASGKIKAGEELTRAYFNIYQNGLNRQDSCAEWLFMCSCERCVLEERLASQKILPVHEYQNILDRVRDDSLKRHTSEKNRSLSILLPNPQPALLQLRKFADSFDEFLLNAEGMGYKEKAWMGASHLDAYLSRFKSSKDKHQLMLGLEIILEFMTNTAILGIGRARNPLRKAALLLDQVENMYGRSSQTYRRIESRVLDLYGTAYGKLKKEVLLSLSRFMTTK